jgi:hypothetical protein
MAASKKNLEVKAASPAAADDLDDLVQSPKMDLRGIDMATRFADDDGQIKKVMDADFRNDQFLSNGSVKKVQDADRQTTEAIGGSSIKGVQRSSN